MSDLDDDSLLASARAGDRRALEALLARHQGQVYRFGLTMCRDRDAAEDVLQNTLLAVSRGVKDFRGASSLSTWLYSIARSYCIKQRRRSKFAPATERSLETDAAVEVARIPDEARAPDEALAGKHVEAVLVEAIDALEPSYREVLVLRDVEGLTAPEVAEILRITPQAVKSRLHRARLAVRERVAPALGIAAPAPPHSSTCPDVLVRFSQHLEGEISADTCADMERHLAACERCRGACDSLQRTLALCQTSAREIDVPPAVQARVKTALRDFLSGPT